MMWNEIWDPEAEQVTDRMFLFMKARSEAEEAGEMEFTCPLCGGKAWWGRASTNGHLRCKCNDCGFSVMA